MIYLDNAATSLPKPRCCEHAMVHALRHMGNPGRSGHLPALAGGRAIYECREALNTLFHTHDPVCYVFCLNCTDALNMAIWGSVAHGGRVITTALEHNSVLRPVHTLAQKRAVQVDIGEPRASGYVHPDDVDALLTPETSLLVVTYASNLTGAVQDIESFTRIAHAKGVPILVDMAQSAGHMDIDLDALGVDMAAFPGHKGLLGPQGTGVLYIRPGFDIEPLRQGGTGSQSQLLLQPVDLPERYESGTPATPALAALCASVNYLCMHHKRFIEHQEVLYAHLWNGLAKIKDIRLYSPSPDDPHVGVISFNLGDVDSSLLADYLWNQHEICCRSGLHCAPLAHKFLNTQNIGAVRLSVGPFNTTQEIDTTLRALRTFSL